MSFCIVEAEARDAGELWTVQRAAFLAEARDLSNPFIPPLNETLAELQFAMGEVVFLKAVEGTRIVGAGRLLMRNDVGWIERVAIAPDCHGRGIGSAMIRALEARATGQVVRFELFTAEVRSMNIAFYERHGYQEIERVLDPTGPRIVHFVKPRNVGNAAEQSLP